MQTKVNGKTISDALAVLKRYAGSGTGSAKGFTLAELRVPDGGGTLIIRRWAWKTFTDVSASIMANGGTAGTAYVAADEWDRAHEDDVMDYVRKRYEGGVLAFTADVYAYYGYGTLAATLREGIAAR